MAYFIFLLFLLHRHGVKEGALGLLVVLIGLDH